MNYRVISYILGWVLGLEALFLTVSAAVGGLYGERTALSFLYAALICAALGIPAVVRKPRRMTFFMKEGFVTVALCWIVFSIFGALPFVFSGEIPHFTDALFETVSGFTTTGASVVPDVEALSHCTLFWRSFTHWIGGMGVLVFLLAILPMAGGSQMYLMQAESPGPSVGKLVPKTRHTALILYSLYILLSIAEFVFLLCGGMSAFDAVNTTFATAGTGHVAGRLLDRADVRHFGKRGILRFGEVDAGAGWDVVENDGAAARRVCHAAVVLHDAVRRPFVAVGCDDEQRVRAAGDGVCRQRARCFGVGAAAADDERHFAR